ncbi:MAG: D-glycero-beta-D-manno-heptose-7-phosphate kinase, partial [Actinobacteria bacterium]|nr:D-glycero-beta-D-manno-heptose-7-phosphate kinase [Actinomycetota bacterium]NIU66636.1 D-glycero-beta-D-manno-heptose-7-phosphate kinase [Actinomycetota bacterium]NIW28442.1 D-glycero-beta-D-manno-heptose-7-phosphate kinase [Actinomycetota bacterium]
TALGLACTVVGCVGDDDAGRTLRSELERQHVSTEGIVTTGSRPTTVKTRVTSRRQQIV